jgi:hypothetical protein
VLLIGLAKRFRLFGYTGVAVIMFIGLLIDGLLGVAEVLGELVVGELAGLYFLL